jgi:hypothetical protein
VLTKFPLLILFTFLSLTCFSSLVVANKQMDSQQFLPEFSAQYTVLHKSDPVGNAIRKLSYQADGSISYHYKTHVEWLIFSQTRSETSILTLNKNKVTPQHYIYTREGTGSDKRYEWRYNAATGEAKDIERKREHNVDFSNNLQDKLSYHLQHRLNLMINAKKSRYIYPVINTSGSIKDYIYEYDGEEELILPYGLIKTIRFKREVKEKERITYAWFAPELDYLLVKLYQMKAGTEQFEAQLSSLTIDGKAVKNP